jgi:mono/diheme cytochrome c family protein
MGFDRARLALSAITLTAGVTVAAQSAPADDVRELYVAQCSKCHGLNGKPKPIAVGAPHFKDPAWTIPLERIVASITNGKGEEMPKFGKKLTPEQIQMLAEYVRSFRDANGSR